VKKIDVKGVKSGIDNTVNDISTLHEQVEVIGRAVRDFHSLENALEGKGGKALRAFFKDTHEPFIVLLHQSLTNYGNILREMNEAIDTFESNESGYISQEFIESEVIEGFDKVETKVIELTDDANSILEEVNELVTTDKIDESSVVEDLRDGKEMVEGLVNELSILDEYEATLLEETKSNLQTMRSFLSDMESIFNSGDISLIDYDVKLLADSSAYKAIMNHYNNEVGEELTALYGSEIPSKPMYEIEKMYEEISGNLNSNDRAVLEYALEDLKAGRIDREAYASYFMAIVHKENSYDPPDDFIEYLGENSVSIGIDAAEEVLVETLTKTENTQQAANLIEKMFRSKTNKITDFIAKHGSKLQGAGHAIGPLTSALGVSLGVYDDMENHDKSIGEALVHHLTSLGTGLIGGAGGAAVVTIFGGSGLIVGGGSILLGTAAVGIFDMAYEHNFLKLQDGLDFVGRGAETTVGWIESGLDNVGQAFNHGLEMWNESVDQVGQGIQNTLDAMNPFNWGW